MKKIAQWHSRLWHICKIKIYSSTRQAIYRTFDTRTQLQLEKPVWVPQALRHTVQKQRGKVILLLLAFLLLQSAIKQFAPHAMNPLNQNFLTRGHKYMQDVGCNI